jgi:uncharacterized protein YbjT (DUF2867 family)
MSEMARPICLTRSAPSHPVCAAASWYELTGPRLLTFAEAVEEIARATGRDIRYVQISNEEFASALTEHDVPADVVAFLTYLFTTVLDGRNAPLANGVERALGRPRRDFTDYARDAAASGVWQNQRALATVRG